MEFDPTTPTPPRPPTPSLRNRPVLIAGILVACSTPTTGFLSYIVAAILFGEGRLEGPGNELTPVGLAARCLPLPIGALLVLWSFLTPKTPTRRTVAVLTTIIAGVLLVLGLWSTLTAAGSGDPSIGGGILVSASLPLAAVGALLLFWPKPSSR